MRHVGLVVPLLAPGTHRQACAVGGFARDLRGQSEHSSVGERR
jgi:hypothetical protein